MAARRTRFAWGVFIDDADVALWVHNDRRPSGRSWVFNLSNDRRGKAVCRVTLSGSSVCCTCSGRSGRCEHVRALRALGLLRPGEFGEVIDADADLDPTTL